MTLVELTLAMGVLAVAVGCLLQILAATSVGQQRLWNNRAAAETARNVAERVVQCSGDWRALCTEFDALPDVVVSVADGDGDPNSGWAKISVHVALPGPQESAATQATLVFGRRTN